MCSIEEDLFANERFLCYRAHFKYVQLQFLETTRTTGYANTLPCADSDLRTPLRQNLGNNRAEIKVERIPRFKIRGG